MSENRPYPIFFDPANRRWPRLRLALWFLGLALSLVAILLITSILANPVLPNLPLPNAIFPVRLSHNPISEERHITKAKRAFKDTHARLQREQEQNLRQFLQKTHNHHQHNSAGRPLIFGYFVNWDDASFNSLKEHIDQIDVLIPEWLHISGSDGALRENDPQRQEQVLQYIRNRTTDLLITPLINNWNGTKWAGADIAQLLKNPPARNRLIQELLAYVEKNHFHGINIDFEDLPNSAQNDMLIFMNELYNTFHDRSLTVSLDVPANNSDWQYRKYTKFADTIILMLYDEHWSTDGIGPIASMGWFLQALIHQDKQIPPEKLVVALANYAYDWPSQGPAQEKTFSAAILTAHKTNAIIRFDPSTLNPYFHYQDEQGIPHQVWMLDAVSAFNQLSAAHEFHPRGYALWRLGSEDPAIWNILNSSQFDQKTATTLETMRFGYALDYEGQGAILRVSSRPHEGSRRINYQENRGLIVDENFLSYPSPYVISRHGYVPKQITLTFDDGPDPEWTPAILDALQSVHAPATFFIIGANAQLYPELIHRIIAEGHEIGNHTFTHPNIANIPELQFQLELSATQRLLESIIGRQTRLFRAPYAIDSEPEILDEIHPLEIASDRGYFSVGMQIDPNDWQRPGTNVIVERVIADAVRGAGNIVLLHDSGGDRSQTVAAIPILVRELRQRGFTIVSLANLLGHSRDDVMPLLTRNPWNLWIDRTGFALVEFAISLVHWLFLLGVILGIGRLLFIGTLAVIQRLHRHNLFDPDYHPRVAVILPAYNEAKVINQTIASLLAGNHPDQFEIIVVDDGSTDDTYQIALQTFAEEPQVRIFTKENGGKASALNFGITHTSAEIVIALDADTVFTRDTIPLLVRHFCDPHVGAVAGNAKVGNRTNLLTRWQALEYITSQNLDRRAFDVLNCITVVPGAVGAWRRELVLQAGLFSDLTLAEDADLTLAIRKLGYAIHYEDGAIALTEAPERVSAFIRQRYRWMYGTMQAAWRHRNSLFRFRYGSLGFIALPNIIIFQVFFPLISPFMDLLLIISLTTAGIDWWQHPDQFSDDGLERILFYYSLFVAVDILAATGAFIMEHREDWTLLVWLVWQRFFYRQLMYYVAIKATIASLKGSLVGWNKLERTATVKIN